MAGGTKIPTPSKSPPSHSSGGSPTACTTPKVQVVGPNVRGKREEYQLVRRLQSALFGGVYEAKGLSSGRDFAIKVLHKSELSKAQETSSIEFCEVPLSEIHFAELMRGDEHVMEAEEHFEDLYCYYVVFDLCRGGDLLEALKQKPHGFEEPHAQFLIKQAAKGLAYLHKRRVAMQDVSLENMLLHVNETSGHYQVKVCDPGQAVVFETDRNGEELPVGFRGLVGKSFRPPELHEQKPYQATKVDSWCLGWSTFYLLTAQTLFMSADPQQQDADWLLFQQGEYMRLFQQKSNLCSRVGIDFIFRLLQLEPSRRMSITDALEHAWLADPTIKPVMAPQELLPDALRKSPTSDRELVAAAASARAIHQEAERAAAATTVQGGSAVRVDNSVELAARGRVGNSVELSARDAPQPLVGQAGLAGTASLGGAGGSGSWLASPGASHSLPTWATASATRFGQPSPPVMRERGRHSQHHPGASARNPYVIATAHSPPPSLTHMALGQPPQPAFLMQRPHSRPKLHSPNVSPLPSNAKAEAAEGDRRVQDRSWAFRSDVSAVDSQRQLAGRQAQSPPRKTGVVYVHRSVSPPHSHTHQGAGSASIPMRLAMRTPSPLAGTQATSQGFVWAQAPGLSPRGGYPGGVPPTSPTNTARGGSVGFAWSPDPPSPRPTQRSFSPANAFTFRAAAFPPVTGPRTSQPRR